MRPITRFYITGGMGDTILSLSALLQYRAKYKEVEAYTNHVEIIKELTAGPHDWIKHTSEFKKNDFWINLCTTATYEFSEDFKGFATDEQAELFLKYSWRFNNSIYLLARSQPYGDDRIAKWAMQKGLTRELLPCYMLGLDLVKFTCEAKEEFFHKGMNYITIHNGHDPNFRTKGSHSTKQWPVQNWEKFVKIIKKKVPDIKIIQVGSIEDEEILGVDYNYVGVTSLKELLQILSHSKLHIDGESGLVHAAAAMKKTSLVLFGPTQKEFFGHAGNINLQTDLSCRGCFWKRSDWMSNCYEGYEENICLSKLSPESVSKVALNYLNWGKHGTRTATAAKNIKKTRRPTIKRNNLRKPERRSRTS